jgi:hypothetical protein
MPVVDVLARADAPRRREARLVDELGDDAPEHEPGRVATTRCAGRGRAKTPRLRSAATRRGAGPRVSSTSGELPSGGQDVEADGAAAAVEGVQRAVGAQQRDRAALQRRPSGRRRVDQQPRDLAVASSWSRASKPAARGERAQLVGDVSSPATTTSARRPPPGAAGGVLGALARVLVPAAPALAPRRPAATMRALSGEGRQRGSPKLSSWKESETS